MTSTIRLRARVPGVASAAVEEVGLSGRRAVVVRIDPEQRRGALAESDSATLAAAARLALDVHLPLIGLISSSGADVHAGVGALDGWGRAARALAACSGTVPILLAVVGPTVSGPALLLGMADIVVMSPDALAYVSGPAMVAQMTGLRVGPGELGGSRIHARSTGVAALLADDTEQAFELLAEALDYLPDHTDLEPPTGQLDDPADRATPELGPLLPTSPTGSYDVRDVARAIADGRNVLELRSGWAPQLVTALARVEGRSVGIVANQPLAMAGTLDIAASQKGARFVAFCDSFNLPIVTLVDTPGFMPGKDLEWRGMIRHGAQLVFAYAEATVPRVCVILRKAYGGAYIVMDSKRLGNDLCLAWPSAEVAVMGAEAAVQVLHRRAEPEVQAQAADDFRGAFLNPHTAAERGYVDEVIDPTETRSAVARALHVLASKRERLPARKHGNTPL
ncbi:MAG TPA: carboxyl transferase domain-containing protein [Acidimicrobiales bacterium]|nr:carboxyl transferase domain-containing protein [Acidimicrobiales bacterium]